MMNTKLKEFIVEAADDTWLAGEGDDVEMSAGNEEFADESRLKYSSTPNFSAS